MFFEIIYILIGGLLGAAFTFITHIFISTNSSISEFGVFFVALSIVNLSIPLAGAGVANLWIKEFNKKKRVEEIWISASLILVLIASSFSVILVIFLSFFGVHESLFTNTLLFLSIYVPAQVLVELIKSKYRIEEKFDRLSLWSFSPQLVLMLLVVIFYDATNSIETVSYIYFLLSICVIVISLIIIKKMFKNGITIPQRLCQDINKCIGGLNLMQIKQVYSKSKFFAFSNFLYLIYFQVDIVILMYLTDFETSGFYSISFVIISSIFLLPSVFYQRYLLPKLFYLYNHKRNIFFKTYKKSWAYIFILSSFFVILLIFANSWIADVLLRGKYIGIEPLLLLLTLSIPVHLFVINADVFITASNMERYKAIYMSITVIINILFNLILIPYYGYYGAAVATIISEVVLLALYLNRYRILRITYS
jgi:O-antigen/teichoic acid export membrane protein